MDNTHYESVIILTPVLSEKMLQDAVEAYKKLITENGGELIHEENWGSYQTGISHSKENNRLLSDL